ncbi:thioredoxin-like domain-containing protein [Chryseobacterium sp. MMS23-Vi53]|uniref:thioredoxin-like domain-containing protein n=1 Tax=Chryseobacterium sp. MMS23-Vi53 TaxID=3386644 RepID=UPI0039EA435F
MKNIFFVVICILTISCNNDEKQTVIKGNIPNLPDGTMYLANLEGGRIDSAKTIKGVFTITHKWNEKEPTYIKINHIDKKGILRFFSFTTNAKYKGVAGWATEAFLSDPTITINGNLKYDTLVGIQFPPDRKPVTGPPLKTGKQTEAFYNIDGDLFDNIDGKMIQTVKEKINKYPYSYHLLYQINDNKNSFSPQQVDEFLKLFKGEIIQSDSYKKLSAYNQKRFNEKNISIPQLENDKGIKSQILDPKYKKHLIVFWASWCGPCREEIPLLKKLYSKDSSVEFVSISIDSDKNAWQKALKEEQMNWKQMISNEKDSSYESLQILFKLNGAIPYTVLVDSNMKILNSSVGLSSEKDLIKLIGTK